MKIVIWLIIMVGLYKILKKLITRSNPTKNPVIISTSVNPQRLNATQSLSINTHAMDRNMNISDFDDLATFVVNPSQSHQPVSNNTAAGRWIAEGEALTIRGRFIEGGFYYFGGRLKTLIGFGTEPSLIDDSLPASTPQVVHSISQLHSDDSLGYWPRYEALSAPCRGAYLDWLASDRSNPSTPIGYIFIYFAGFERRIIENINNAVVSDKEFIAIYKEVARLHRIYGEQLSFGSYSANFMEFMTLIRSPLFEDPILSADLPPLPETNMGLQFKMKLAKTVALETPISAELAWSWLQNSEHYNAKTPAKRCPTEFKALFGLRYHQAFPNGFIIKPNKTRLKISYRSASRSIIHVDLTLDDLPDPSRLKAPVDKLIKIAEGCHEELDAYSRYLGKEGSSNEDVQALLLLPPVLIQHKSIPVIERFKCWAQQIVKEHEGLTSVKELWVYLEEPLPDSLTSKTLSKKQNELVINLAQLAGFGIAPDQRYHQSKLKFDGYLVLFAEGHGTDFKVTSTFEQLMLALRLGAMVATIDGYVHKTEIDALLNLIESESSLNTIERASLTAYLLWQLNTPANMAGLKALLAKQDENHRQFISRFIISVALANGSVDPSQIKQIEKLYQALGLDKSAVTNDIHHLGTAKKRSQYLNSQTPDQRNDSQHDANHNLSEHESDDKSRSQFNFDTDVLALIEKETGDAKAMLASIFDSEQEQDDLPQIQESAMIVRQEMSGSQLQANSTQSHTNEQSNCDFNQSSSSIEIHNDRLIGLDQTHSALYRSLIKKQVWERDEVSELCDSLNLMINGAIETINDWAYDAVDAPVIEDDDEIIVDLEIVEEIKQL